MSRCERLGAAPGRARKMAPGSGGAASMPGRWQQDTERRGYEYTEIVIPGSTRTQLQGIDARGEIVGWYASGGVTHGLLLRKRARNPVS